MDSGLAAVLGSVVGTVGTLGTTWLNARLNRKKPDAAEEATKKLLREMLEHPTLKWRHVSTLSNVVGLDKERVRHFLLQIGARGSARDGEVGRLLADAP
jgi:hypothetical protein